jgi:hypothetical protein
MSQRYNEVNNSGIVTVSGGNMPTDAYTNQYQPTSRTAGQGGAGGKASIIVIANSHPVEVDGDGGLWDTTSGVSVLPDQTNILCIGT